MATRIWSALVATHFPSVMRHADSRVTGLEVDERVKRSPLQAPPGELGKEALDRVEPRA